MFDAAWDSESGPGSQALVLPEGPAGEPAKVTGRRSTRYSSFWGTAVPVPRMRWLEPDASILGGPFFIMDRILNVEGNTRAPQAPPFLAVQAEIARKHVRDTCGDSHVRMGKARPLEGGRSANG